jgi:hypothetical protein
VDEALRLVYDNLFAVRDRTLQLADAIKKVPAPQQQNIQQLLTTLPGYEFFQTGNSTKVLNQQASMVPGTSGGFTYDNSVAGQIVWSWAGLKVQPANLATQPQNYILIPDGSITITGLTPGDTVYFYPRYPVSGVPALSSIVGAVSGLIEWVGVVGTGAVGTPQIGYDTTKNATAAQAQMADGYIPLSNGGMGAVVTGGGGGGGGGGGSACLRKDMLVERKGDGKPVPLYRIKSGDWIRGRLDWTQVTACVESCQSPLMLAQFACPDWCDFIAGSVTHPLPTCDDGQATELQDASVSRLYVGRSEGTEHPLQLKAAVVLEGKWDCVLLRCAPEHEFWAGAHAPVILNHNVLIYK